MTHSQPGQHNAQVQQQAAQLQSQQANAGQHQPQVITLQQLQNFLPAGQQIQTISAADAHQVKHL